MLGKMDLLKGAVLRTCRGRDLVDRSVGRITIL